MRKTARIRHKTTRKTTRIRHKTTRIDWKVGKLKWSQTKNPRKLGEHCNTVL